MYHAKLHWDDDSKVFHTPDGDSFASVRECVQKQMTNASAMSDLMQLRYRIKRVNSSLAGYYLGS